MLGQFLLREPAGATTAWDEAFAAVEQSRMTLAADVLLDALFLDPSAEQFLSDRATLLFENRGARLNRFLRRFLHIATVPSVPVSFKEVDPSLALHIEARYRLPIYGRWPPIARFLHRHMEQVAPLISPEVSKVCETWVARKVDAAGAPFRFHPFDAPGRQ